MKKMYLGIRREDKNPWEKRVAIVPDDLRRILKNEQIGCIVQPSLDHRVFQDHFYQSVGAEISEDLEKSKIIFGIKEIPKEKFLKNKVYVFFSHVIKGQPYNMSMLKRLMEQGCSLIDYEKIEDENNRRLIFFGRYAGLSGMVETLHAFGQRLESKQIMTPFTQIKRPRDYQSLDDIKRAIKTVGDQIKMEGLPAEITPLICGFTGYGNVSKGAQEIFDLLPVVQLNPCEISSESNSLGDINHRLYKVEFHEKDMFTPKETNKEFELQDYFQNPSKYRSIFSQYVPQLSMLVNGIFWTEECPRIITRDLVGSLFNDGSKAKLQVIGDISCDIEGSIEITTESTDIDNPAYVYNPDNQQVSWGIEGKGIAVVAIENLPCEIPLEASTDFSKVLSPFVEEIVTADYSKPFSQVELPREIKKAVIVYQGELTADFKYIENFLSS